MRKSVNESYVERKVCKYAETLGWFQAKYSSLYDGGRPDRIFLRGESRLVKSMFFIEFKKAGKEARKLQVHKHEELEAHYFRVFVIDNEADGIKLFDDIEKGSIEL